MFPTRKLWSEHEFVQHRVKESFKCHECAREFANAESYTLHLGEYHHLKFNQLQLRAFLSAATSSVPPSWPNEYCPLCLEMGWASQRKFTTHVARHMEEIALASLPRDVGDDGDSSSNDDIEGQDTAHDENGEDQDSVQAERDPGSSLRAAVNSHDGWIPSPTSPPTLGGQNNSQYESQVAVERARASSATFSCCHCPERFSRRIALTDHQHECKRKAEFADEATKMRANARNDSRESTDGNIKPPASGSHLQIANSPQDLGGTRRDSLLINPALSVTPPLAPLLDSHIGHNLPVPSTQWDDPQLPSSPELHHNWVLKPIQIPGARDLSTLLFNTHASHNSPTPSNTEWSGKPRKSPVVSPAGGSSNRPPRPNLPREPRLFKEIFKDSQDTDDVSSK
jgi:hypothetical protein